MITILQNLNHWEAERVMAGEQTLVAKTRKAPTTYKDLSSDLIKVYVYDGGKGATHKVLGYYLAYIKTYTPDNIRWATQVSPVGSLANNMTQDQVWKDLIRKAKSKEKYIRNWLERITPTYLYYIVYSVRFDKPLSTRAFDGAKYDKPELYNSYIMRNTGKITKPPVEWKYIYQPSIITKVEGF